MHTTKYPFNKLFNILVLTLLSFRDKRFSENLKKYNQVKALIEFELVVNVNNKFCHAHGPIQNTHPCRDYLDGTSVVGAGPLCH